MLSLLIHDALLNGAIIACVRWDSIARIPRTNKPTSELASTHKDATPCAKASRTAEEGVK
jgi:hypothetical protein